jgi:exonuclease V gamma subunit
LFQDEAIRRLMETQSPTTDRVLFLDNLKFELYRHLTQALRTGDPVFEPLFGRTERPDPSRVFEIADHVAGVFHNYAMNSRWWPKALSEGKVPPGIPVSEAVFLWQARLWSLVNSGGQTLAGLRMERLTQAPPAGQGSRPRLVLVGSAFLSRRAAAFLRAWADAGLVDVVQLLLLPAPVETGWPSGRPWASWGAFGRAFLQALPPLTESVLSPPGTTALEILQGSLASGQKFPGAPADTSLTVVSCSHPLRELEVLRDHLLAALAADPTLETHEIAVLAPDINVYAPFLDAAFPSDDPGRHLDFHVIDLDLGRENPWFQALDALLGLLSGTIDRPGLFALVDSPEFQEAWGLDREGRDLWLSYTEEVSAWREDRGSGPQSWTASWDRLFWGWFRPDAADGPPPLDTSTSVFQALGRFHRLLTALRSAREETLRPRTFLDWVRFLDDQAAVFLAPGEGVGAVLSGRLRTLALDAGDSHDLWPWTGFRAFLQDQIAHFPGRRGQLLTEGVHCSSLRPLRAIPFRVIAILGLDEGAFPRRSPEPSFDLRRFEDGQEALSSLALDRYTFWETLMSARSGLYLSYQGRSAVDGSERPPSPVLADLLDYLEEAGRPWPVVQTAVKDFSEATATWSPRTWRRSRAYAGTLPPEEPSQVPDPAEDALAALFPEVRAQDAVQAFVAPARFHLRRVRQIILRDEDHRGTDDEEPWSLPFLERHGWVQEGLRRFWAGEPDPWDVDAFVGLVEATGQARPGVFSDRDRAELRHRAEEARRWAEDLKAEGWTGSPAPMPRTHWAGKPWADDGDRLVRGTEILLPRLLFAAALPPRGEVEASLRVLQDLPDGAYLATLSPSGQRKVRTWGPDASQTEVLADRAQEFWGAAVRRPLPFSPDLWDAVARRRDRDPDEPWTQTLEGAWRTARDATFGRTEATLARDPYAALVFPDDPGPEWAPDLERWWKRLFGPLWRAWS